MVSRQSKRSIINAVRHFIWQGFFLLDSGESLGFACFVTEQRYSPRSGALRMQFITVMFFVIGFIFPKRNVFA